MSCIIGKFNSFNIVRLELDRKLRRELCAIDTIYKPVRSDKENLNCYFTTQINLAYKTSFSKADKIRHGTASQCYFCLKYFGRKNMWERHLQSCTGHSGFVYNFNTRSLLTFEENLKYKSDNQ